MAYNSSKALAQRTLSGSSWNISNVLLAKIFGTNDASVLISNLISKDTYFENNNKKYNGWFFNTAKQLEKDTAVSPFTQRRLFNVFKEIGLLKIKLKGVPPKQHFKIDYFALEALLHVNCEETAKLNVKKLQNQMLRNLTYINKIQVISNKEEKKELFVSTKNSNKKDKAFKLSTKLSKIIQTKKNVKHTLTQIKQWTVELRLMEKKDGITYARQKEVLNWYADTIGGEYIPVVESGSTFRSKFTKLEDAIKREEQKSRQLGQAANKNGYRNKTALEYSDTYEKR